MLLWKTKVYSIERELQSCGLIYWRKMKILVAEDDSMMQKLIVGLLEKWGHEVLAASDGLEALELLKNSCDSPPGVALVDWVMPELSGLELCEKIKKDGEIPYFIYFILLTGRRKEEDIVMGLSAGADDYIVKPIKKGELKSRLDVGVRMVEYERRLRESNAALSKYARIMESLAEEKAKQLAHAERLAMLGELSAGLAHEINNYVAPI